MARSITILISLAAGALFMAAFAQAILSGHVSLFSRSGFGASLALAAALLIAHLRAGRLREKALADQMADLREAAGRIESSLRNATAANEQLRESSTHYQALIETLTAARDRAQAASGAKSAFLATMSRQIQAAMTDVLDTGRLLLESGLTPGQQNCAEAITKTSEGLLGAIGDVLDFAKIESGELAPEKIAVDLRGLLWDIADLLAPRAHAKNIELVAVVAKEAPHLIQTDGTRLRQLLINLAGDALKFTDKGGIGIHAAMAQREEKPFLAIEVRDTAPRVPSASGLGLAIARRLAETMGGEIGITSSSTGGPTFCLALPVAVVKPAAEATPLDGRCVAIVGHNKILKEGLRLQIEALGGQVLALSDFQSRARLDAVLIDGGTDRDFETFIPPGVEAPALVLVTEAGRSRLQDYRALGFADYLVKPVRDIALVERLNGVFAAHSGAPAPSMPDRREPRAALKILLAEDDPVNAFLFLELLRQQGHAVTGVASGAAALAACEHENFDIFLTDIRMPGMDGIETARAMRTLEQKLARRRIPIVALTAELSPGDRKSCRAAGMDGFLLKPVDPLRLEEIFATMFPSGERVSHTAAA